MKISKKNCWFAGLQPTPIRHPTGMGIGEPQNSSYHCDLHTYVSICTNIRNWAWWADLLRNWRKKQSLDSIFCFLNDRTPLYPLKWSNRNYLCISFVPGNNIFFYCAFPGENYTWMMSWSRSSRGASGNDLQSQTGEGVIFKRIII